MYRTTLISSTSTTFIFFFFVFFSCIVFARAAHISRHNRIVVFFTTSAWTLFTLFTHNNYEYLRLCILTKILKLNITHDNTGRQKRRDRRNHADFLSRVLMMDRCTPSYNARNMWLFDDVSYEKRYLSLSLPLFFLSSPLEGNKYKNSQCFFDLVIRQRI